MEQETRGRRQVDLFNFSFLDILACVIGLLIFILTIVVISGGGSASSAKAKRLTTSDHAVRDARMAAQFASQRRTQIEELLRRRAGDFLNPKESADLIGAEISLYQSETKHFAIATEKTGQQLATILAEQDRVAHRPLAPSPQAVADILLARDLNRESDALAQQATAARAAVLEQHAVRYYLPRLRETSRSNTFVEVSGDRMWCLESGDYEMLAIDQRSTRYERRPSAKGVSVAGLISGRDEVPGAVSNRTPTATVLSVLVRPDGYEAFRKLREWAWARGFAVNWDPAEVGEVIALTRMGHAHEQ